MSSHKIATSLSWPAFAKHLDLAVTFTQQINRSCTPTTNHHGSQMWKPQIPVDNLGAYWLGANSPGAQLWLRRLPLLLSCRFAKYKPRSTPGTTAVSATHTQSIAPLRICPCGMQSVDYVPADMHKNSK